VEERRSGLITVDERTKKKVGAEKGGGGKRRGEGELVSPASHIGSASTCKFPSWPLKWDCRRLSEGGGHKPWKELGGLQ